MLPLRRENAFVTACGIPIKRAYILDLVNVHDRHPLSSVLRKQAQKSYSYTLYEFRPPVDVYDIAFRMNVFAR